MLKVCGMIPFEFSLAENDGPQGKRRDCEKKEHSDEFANYLQKAMNDLSKKQEKKIGDNNMSVLLTSLIFYGIPVCFLISALFNLYLQCKYTDRNDSMATYAGIEKPAIAFQIQPL